MKRNKQFIFGLVLISMTVFLTACSTQPVTEASTGIWDRYIIYNLSQFIIWLSSLFGGNYGMGIIVFTIITRLLLLPAMHFQYKSSRQTAILQPQIKALREKYSSRDSETQQQLREEMNALYEREGVNQYAGCLPMVIQLPVMIALYQAISRTEVLKMGHFLWLNLGEPDPYFILPILAAIFTYLTSWLSSKMQDMGGAKMMMYILPVMIFVFSLQLPSALSLYWVVGNIFSVIQTLVMNNPFKFQAEMQEKARLEKEKRKEIEKARRRLKGSKKRRK